MGMNKFQYKCNDCGNTFEEAQVKYLCPSCKETNSLDLPPKGVLKTVYNYKKLIENNINFESLSRNKFLDRFFNSFTF